MTVHSDIAAVTPTVTAKNSFSARGINLTGSLASIQQDVLELQAKIKQLVAFHPNDSVLSATVNAGGSGGTNGVVTITGTSGVGTKFQAKGIVSGGALTSITSITMQVPTQPIPPVSAQNPYQAGICLAQPSL